MNNWFGLNWILNWIFNVWMNNQNLSPMARREWSGNTTIDSLHHQLRCRTPIGSTGIILHHKLYGNTRHSFSLKERASMSLLCLWSVFFPSDPTRYSSIKAIWMCFESRRTYGTKKNANSRLCIVRLKPNHLPGPVGPQTNFAILWNNLCNPDSFEFLI